MGSIIREYINNENISKSIQVLTDFVETHRTALYYGVGTITVGLVSYKFGKEAKQRIFVWVNSNSHKIKPKEYENYRVKMTNPLKTLKSYDPELRKENSIRILEIGVGCGSNFQYYPEGSHLVLVDPNPHFAKEFSKKLDGTLKISPEDIIISTAEEMDMVKSESIDAVVVSLVLCSVSDVAKVAQQIRRVLAPGGKFLFMEHVFNWDVSHRGARMLQQILTVTRIWPFLFEGCNLNRDPLPTINAAGFSDVKAHYSYAPFLYRLFRTVASPHVVGEATK